MEVTRASLSAAQDENLPTELDESYTVTSLTAHGTASSPIVVRKQPPATTTFSLHRAPPRAFPPRPVSSNLFGPHFNSATTTSSTGSSSTTTITGTQPDATTILSSSPEDQRRQWWEFVGYSTTATQSQPTGTGKLPLLPRKGM